MSQGGIDEYIHRIGRTARIDNSGDTVFFMNETNSDIAPDLAKVMVEAGNDLPDFLAKYAPGDGNLGP